MQSKQPRLQKKERASISKALERAVVGNVNGNSRVSAAADRIRELAELFRPKLRELPN